MNNQGYFITGTDTGVGKTCVTLALMRHFQRKGYRVAGMKPVASGCDWYDGQLQNQDALMIQEQCSDAVDYELINPYSYEQPISPHLAGVSDPAQLATIQSCYAQLQRSADRVIVEGAGGWYSPLSMQLDNAGLALALELPVLLVVAMRLGCINHACLSWRAIIQSGLECKGWMAVCIDPEMQALQDNIVYLQNMLTMPLLGILPYSKSIDFDAFSQYITIK